MDTFTCDVPLPSGQLHSSFGDLILPHHVDLYCLKCCRHGEVSTASSVSPVVVARVMQANGNIFIQAACHCRMSNPEQRPLTLWLVVLIVFNGSGQNVRAKLKHLLC